MKTSLDLPDDLYRQVKSKSALEGRAVREVATALFTAWVEGRVDAMEPDAPARDAIVNAPEPGQVWLRRWRELRDDVTKATTGADGLVDALIRDRR